MQLTEYRFYLIVILIVQIYYLLLYGSRRKNYNISNGLEESLEPIEQSISVSYVTIKVWENLLGNLKTYKSMRCIFKNEYLSFFRKIVCPSICISGGL